MNESDQIIDRDKTPGTTRKPGLPRFRFIGEPSVIDPLECLDFKQHPFTLEGLASAHGLEDADVIMYWPSTELFDKNRIGEELIRLSMPLTEMAPVIAPLGVKVVYNIYRRDLFLKAQALVGISAGVDGFHAYEYSEDMVKCFHLCPDERLRSTLSKSLWDIQKHISYARLHQESVRGNTWDFYKDHTGYDDPRIFVGVVVGDVLHRCYTAASRGAAIAVVATNDFVNRGMTKSNPHRFDFGFAYAWFACLAFGVSKNNGKSNVDYALCGISSPWFDAYSRTWSAIKVNPDVRMYIQRSLSDNSSFPTTKGILSYSDFSLMPHICNPMISGIEGCKDSDSPNVCSFVSDMPVTYAPLRYDSDGNPQSMIMRFGSGGFVLMPEPINIKSLFIPHDNIEKAPFRRIEFTNRRASIKGQREDGYILEVTPSTGAKSDVPMTVSTFRRFLAFCVAAKLASSKGLLGTIDLTNMTIGKHDLSGVVDPVTPGQGHRPGQLIQEAFDDVLKSKYGFIQASPGREKDTRRLHPDLWNIVKFDKLMKQVQKPRKTDTENEDALRKIFSVLKQP